MRMCYHVNFKEKTDYCLKIRTQYRINNIQNA